MKITDEMVERAFNAYYAPGNIEGALRRALEAAMNPPPVVCKNCGKDISHHTLVLLQGEEFRVCSDAVWSPNDKVTE